MKRVKIIFGYIFGFILTALIVCLAGAYILKSTIFNKNYIKHVLNEKNYYEVLSKEILENMKNYNMSSGLPDEIFDGLFSKEEIKEDIEVFIDDMYDGKVKELENDTIKDRLNNNIDNYLNSHDVKVTNKSYIDSFVNEIGNIYQNEVGLYGTLNNYFSKFNKISNYLNKIFIVLIIVTVIFSVLLLLFNKNIFGSVISASGLIILFIRLVFYDKIDINNILIVSNFFSDMLKILLSKIGDLMLLGGIMLIILGILLSLLKSFEKKKAKKQ